MSVIALTSAKASPGVSTTVAALATQWPGPVLVVDADPQGGDLLAGWAGPWWVDGSLTAQRSVVSFATATRHLDAVPAGSLAGHVQSVPELPQVRLLAGVRDRSQADALGTAGWRRLAYAIRDVSDDGEPDVLIDLGRHHPEATPWVLAEQADLVLLALRPTLRHLRTSLPLAETLTSRLPAGQLGAAVLASDADKASSISQTLDLPLRMRLPDDAGTARFFSDGLLERRHRRQPLLGAARHTAHQFHVENHPNSTSPPHQNVEVAADARTTA